MVILVTGNINSGKSFFIKRLRKELPLYVVAQIDKFRQKFGDGTQQGEEMARSAFIDYVSSTEDVIAELSGLGPLGTMLVDNLPDKSCLIFWINECAEKCIERLPYKDFKAIPYPSVVEKLEDTILRIDKEFNSGEFKNFWKNKAINIIEINNDTEISKLPIMQYHYLNIVLKKLKSLSTIKEIIGYGSLARNEMSALSDIDICAVTDLTLEDVKQALSETKELSYIDDLEGKVTLYFKNVLIEVVVVKELKEIEWFYINGNIKDANNSILKGTKETAETLQQFLDNFKINKQLEISKTTKRLNFYLRSLDRLAQGNDDYKYFFHTNIVIHELVKLSAFYKGNFKYSYLPKQALREIDFDIKKAVYDFKKEKSEHLKELKQLLNELPQMR
ncbi:MAG: nucleotidyltransferase domain-containing protein [Candidatus ainarchaeum sp.]|nr:nucleotidyltransferase domain-containing protein [Acholeplasmataceae bacterium]MDD3085199.1 nucleotidyltransferase domain-containing protein [Candidatus ainarchaeum sp.]